MAQFSEFKLPFPLGEIIGDGNASDVRRRLPRVNVASNATHYRRDFDLSIKRIGSNWNDNWVKFRDFPSRHGVAASRLNESADNAGPRRAGGR